MAYNHSIKLDEINRLQQVDHHYFEVIKVMQRNNKTIFGDFSLDSKGVLYRKISDHNKDIKALIGQNLFRSMCYIKATTV